MRSQVSKPAPYVLLYTKTLIMYTIVGEDTASFGALSLTKMEEWFSKLDGVLPNVI